MIKLPRAISSGFAPGALLAALGAGAAMLFGVFAARLTWGPPLVMVGLGGMTLVLGALALYRVIDPLINPEASAPLAPRAPARLRELERDKQAVLKAIREIEHDYQMRKIAEPDYREMLQRYRGRAMRIIRELDAGDDYRALIEEELKTRLAAPALPACKACGATNDVDAKFCKKCGAGMTVAS